MAIHYQCRHCGTKVGTLTHAFNSETLGLDRLSDEERLHMIHYRNDGDIEIKTICEDCQESLERYPDYHGLDHIIQ
ncbi:anti-sigma-F factor Fin family protein [Rossellomorea marisflavi]|uniref:anti-sigma-F factor Fin family protein n=1 Tax=Rossellomorea marisflavi TaxID=189381 RepID=UPI001C444E20|nr:anti-sigma-F factor Fin family protein [Rossellomorea marisflavi]MBV6686142.1 anti-sigma-F factor Fin family protein [Bacillus sp. JRC01]UTE72916.1 anti-sigma-F factor Fin family protein [Rossellomorea marisflavi]